MIDLTARPTLAGTNRPPARMTRARRASALIVAALAAAALVATTPAGAVVVPGPTPVPSAAAASGGVGAITPGLPSAPPAPPPAVPPPGGEPVGGALMGAKGVVVNPAAGGAPNVAAPSWLIADATTGAVLAARDAHGRARPASTQKVLLALTFMQKLDPTGTYTADHDDEAVEGTRVGMVANEAYPINDLWYGVFLRSGNDAADGIAKAGAGGSMATAVQDMQAQARHLQAYDTTVADPNGLDADGQYASAYDLALWGRAAMKIPAILKYAGTVTYEFPGNTTSTGTAKSSKPFQILTENRLLYGANLYQGTIGLKPGYTTLAQNTFIGVAQRNGTTIIVTLMHDGRGIFPEAKTLLDWGFAHDGNTPPVGRLVDPIGTVHPTATASPVQHLAAGEDGVSLRPLTEHWPAVGGSVLGVGLISTAAGLRLRVRRRRRRLGVLR